ncbi:MAG: sensor histidine kinase N-terminal domain-containing protein [Bdellovibrio sp.]|nr:sensor histidine kinase N-terminal domain-containing protein [Methylotenera sp.]
MVNLKQLLPQHSLKNQLFSWLLSLLLPLIFITAAAGYFLSSHYINLAYDKSLYRTALALANQVSLEALGAQVDLPQVAKDLLEFDEDDDIYFRITGPRGDLLTSHSDLPLPKSYPNADQSLYYNANLAGKKLRVAIYALPISAEFSTNAATNNVYVMVGETLEKRRRMASEILLSMLLPQLLIILLVSGLLFFGIKRGLQPLDTFKNDLKQRNINDLSPVDNSQAPKELWPLLNAFNDLLTRVNGAVSKEQRFIADAAHQLKTPLAGLKTQAELALREKEPAKIAHALDQINQASGNLAHMVNQLLILSKAEPDGATFLTLNPVDLLALAQSATSDWVELALHKKIDLGFSSNLKTAFINGNAALLRELINNLIDNAIRYTPLGGRITVGIRQENKAIIFEVQDDGIGLESENQALIFERFYRVLGTQQDGCGLGLTIVQEIAERHGATVSVMSNGPGKGSLFIVRFNG